MSEQDSERDDDDDESSYEMIPSSSKLVEHYNQQQDKKYTNDENYIVVPTSSDVLSLSIDDDHEREFVGRIQDDSYLGGANDVSDDWNHVSDNERCYDDDYDGDDHDQVEKMECHSAVVSPACSCLVSPVATTSEIVPTVAVSHCTSKDDTMIPTTENEIQSENIVKLNSPNPVTTTTKSKHTSSSSFRPKGNNKDHDDGNNNFATTTTMTTTKEDKINDDNVVIAATTQNKIFTCNLCGWNYDSIQLLERHYQRSRIHRRRLIQYNNNKDRKEQQQRRLLASTKSHDDEDDDVPINNKEEEEEGCSNSDDVKKKKPDPPGIFLPLEVDR